MPTIAEQLQQIATIKANIKAAIEAKGETVGSDSFATYPTHIANISGGGGGSEYEDSLKSIVSRTGTSVTIPSGVTGIGQYAFAYHQKLTSIVIPEGVTKLNNYCFQAANALLTADLPSTLTSVGATVFHACTKLGTIICRATTPPTFNANSFGTSTGTYTGRTTYSAGTNKLYVPRGCTSAYTTALASTALLDATKCGFTITELDANGNIPT